MMGFQVNDRIELPDCELYAHGKGFNLKMGDEIHSLIPVVEIKGVIRSEIEWELKDNDGNIQRFPTPQEAFRYILENQKGQKINLIPAAEFFGGDSQ